MKRQHDDDDDGKDDKKNENHNNMSITNTTNTITNTVNVNNNNNDNNNDNDKTKSPLKKRARLNENGDVDDEIQPQSSVITPTSLTTNTTTTNNTTNSTCIHERLCKLLKFWLSGSNLSKDRHLLTKLTEDETHGWTCISIFLKFNKVTQISPCISQLHIKQALQSLDFIELNSNTDKFRFLGGMKVLKHRVKQALENVDQRTIFITSFPNCLTREHVIEQFEKIHHVHVLYVSIPKLHGRRPHRHSGFAFVELETVTQANKVLREWKHYVSKEIIKGGGIENCSVFPHKEWVRRKESRKKRRQLKEKKDSSWKEEEEEEENDDDDDDDDIEEEEEKKGKESIAFDKILNRHKSQMETIGVTRENKSTTTMTAAANGVATVNKNTDKDCIMKERTDNDITSSHTHVKNNNDEQPSTIRKQTTIPKNPSTSSPSSSLPLQQQTYDPKLILSISNLPSCSSKTVTRASLFEEFEEFGPISYIEYAPKRNPNACKIRYVHESGIRRAKRALSEHGIIHLGIPPSLIHFM